MSENTKETKTSTPELRTLTPRQSLVLEFLLNMPFPTDGSRVNPRIAQACVLADGVLES